MKNYQKTERLFYETFGLRCKVAGVTCIFMSERHGVLPTSHGYACWLQPAATRPSPQITLGRLVFQARCFLITKLHGKRV